jgi:FkbM family methyltransferase
MRRRSREAPRSWRGRGYDLARTVAMSPLAASLLTRSSVPSRYRDAVRTNQQIRVLLAAELRADSNCLDIGSYRGDVLREMVRRAPLGHHIAWEPLPYMASALRRRFPTVEIREAAVSDHVGRAEFSNVRSRPTYSGLRLRPDAPSRDVQSINVRTETVDGVLPMDFVPHLVKIDVEGALVQVLSGALNMLTQHRPIVLFEYGHLARQTYGTTFDDVYQLLHDECRLGIYDLYGYGPLEVAQLEEIDDRSDWIARPLVDA